jgi:flagellar motor protein MotB
MKKILLLLTALVVMGTMAAPQVQAQDMQKLEQLEREFEQLERAVERQGGQPTPQQLQRIQQIQQEVIQAMGSWGELMQQTPQQGQQQSQDTNQMMRQMQQQQQQTQQFEQMLRQSDEAERRQQQEAAMYPGQTRGWPSASIFSQCNLPNLRQPAGTTVSYDYRQDSRSLTLYIMNGTQSTAAELVRAIEAGGKVRSREVGGGTTYLQLAIPPGIQGFGRNGPDVYYSAIELIDGGVKLFTYSGAG